MKDHGFFLNGASVIADPSGVLWWPGHRTLIVADLHLEKASAYAAGGILLPPYDSLATVERLTDVIRRLRPSHVLALGDSFHDAEAADRLDPSVARALRAQVSALDRWTWIAGNHDPVPPEGFGGSVASEVEIGPLRFRHEPIVSATGEVAGHLHPKIRISTRARRIGARCFITDGQRIVLPAFGALTGGLDIGDTAFRRLFPGAAVALALGPERVHAIRVGNGRPG
jgi:DNA ligase-associated metallophosphoesterase